MRTRIQVVFLVLCTSLCLSSLSFAKDKKNAAGGEDQIKAMLEQSRQATLKGDSSYIEQNASDDYTRVNQDGKLFNKSDAVNALKSGDLKLQSVEPGDVKVRVYGDAAVATYTVDVKGTNKGQDMSGRHQLTRVFAKRGGKWQEVAFQSTKVAQ